MPSGMNDRMRRSFARSCSSMRCDLTSRLRLMSLKAVATSASSSLEPASTCTPSSPAAIRCAAVLSRRSGRTKIWASTSESRQTKMIMPAVERMRLRVKSSTGTSASAEVSCATITQFRPSTAERRVRGEAVATEVVALEERAVLARERPRHRLARDRLLQQRVAVLHAQRGRGRRRGPRRRHPPRTRRDPHAAGARWTASSGPRRRGRSRRSCRDRCPPTRRRRS